METNSAHRVELEIQYWIYRNQKCLLLLSDIKSRKEIKSDITSINSQDEKETLKNIKK